MRLIRYALALLPMLLLLANSTSSDITKKSPATSGTGIAAVSAGPGPMNSPGELFEAWNLEAAGLSRDAFEKAARGYEVLQSRSLLKKDNLLTIIDYSKPSSQKRLFVLDMITGNILFNSLVAHGRNSGLDYATDFSNSGQSHKSSLGFFITLDTYKGGNGYSLKLKGCEAGINDNAFKRAIVMHGAGYVHENFIRRNGYLGRSYGCPAVPLGLTKKIIDVIKGGSCMFLYYPSKNYITRSKILNT